MTALDKQTELDYAKQQLENAQTAYKNWSYQNCHRQDGSGAQDARHEEIGRDLYREVKVWEKEVAELESSMR